MQVLIQGDALNVAVFDGDDLNVISIIPSFRADIEPQDALASKPILNNMFKSMFGDKLITTESYQELEPTSMIRELNIELIKNNGSDCIRCSIAEAWYQETEIPCIIDYAPVTSLRSEEFGAYCQYKAVVIDHAGYVHPFYGLSRNPFYTVFKSSLIKSAPMFNRGEILEVDTERPAIKHVLDKGGLISNLGSWFK
jgi:hypothetical protein